MVTFMKTISKAKDHSDILSTAGLPWLQLSRKKTTEGELCDVYISG